MCSHGWVCVCALGVTGMWLRCVQWRTAQEIAPDFVATHSQAPAVVDGHPFVVEAGVSLGGRNAKEGITVFRFANRIPLLFEGGADVVTRTATKRIKSVRPSMWQWVRWGRVRCVPAVCAGSLRQMEPVQD